MVTRSRGTNCSLVFIRSGFRRKKKNKQKVHSFTCVSDLKLAHVPALKDGLAWLKLKPVPEVPKRPVAVLGVAAAGAPNRPPALAAIGLEGPFLPAW